MASTLAAFPFDSTANDSRDDAQLGLAARLLVRSNCNFEINGLKMSHAKLDELHLGSNAGGDDRAGHLLLHILDCADDV